MASVVFADLVASTALYERLGDEIAGRFVAGLTGKISAVFTLHSGRVVKLLGDGVFAVFARESDALAACVSLQQGLNAQPLYPRDGSDPVGLQIGLEAGEIVEIDGDCYGDAVNSAARLASLAGAGQIMTTQRVAAALDSSQQGALRALGAMHLRGKSQPVEVFRVEWMAGQELEATTMSASPSLVAQDKVLEISGGSVTVQVPVTGAPLTFGRASDCAISFNDARVSRTHATVAWRGGQFVLGDVSSFGTWVYPAHQQEPIVLRRSECFLAGTGLIALGCDRHRDCPALLRFHVESAQVGKGSHDA